MPAAINPHRRQLLRDGLFCLSLANLFFLKAWSEVLRSFAIPAYYKYHPNGAYLAIMLNVILLGAVFYLGLFLIRRSGKRWLVWGGKMVFALVVLFILNSARQLANWQPLAISHLARNPVFWLLAGVLAVVIGWRCRLVMRMTRHLVLILAPFFLMTFGRTLWHLDYGFKQCPSNGERSQTVPASGILKHSRVVWLLFDTLDQRIAFAERPQSIQLPELDRFRSQSVYFENAGL